MTYVGQDWAEKGANHIHQDCHQENPFSLKEKTFMKTAMKKKTFFWGSLDQCFSSVNSEIENLTAI